MPDIVIVPTLPDSRIPTEEDWQSEGWHLDTVDAYKNFFGASFLTAMSLFEENAIRYSEDLMWMPARCFSFYFQAYAAYVMSPQAQWDCNGASCFLALCEYKGDDGGMHAPENIKVIRAMAPLLRPVLEHLATHQEFFDASVEIYGDFETRVKNILSLDCFKE